MIRFACLALALVAACKGKDKKEESAPAPGSGSAAPGSAVPAQAPPPPPPSPTPAPPAGGAVATGAVQNKADSATQLACEQGARDVKGDTVTSWYMKCPADCKNSGTVWGTDIYTDDSTLCTAAVHSGAITAKDGGLVLVTWGPGQPTYLGGERNGIHTQDYLAWKRSFFVQKVDASGQPTTPPPKFVTEPETAHLSCRMAGGATPGAAGAKWTVDCPANCQPVTIYGSDPYTDDSPICSAAIHAGVIDRAAGGTFVITIDSEQKEFKGSSNHGVSSNDWGAYGRSYHVAKK